MLEDQAGTYCKYQQLLKIEKCKKRIDFSSLGTRIYKQKTLHAYQCCEVFHGYDFLK